MKRIEVWWKNVALKDKATYHCKEEYLRQKKRKKNTTLRTRKAKEQRKEQKQEARKDTYNVKKKRKEITREKERECEYSSAWWHTGRQRGGGFETSRCGASISGQADGIGGVSRGVPTCCWSASRRCCIPESTSRPTEPRFSPFSSHFQLPSTIHTHSNLETAYPVSSYQVGGRKNESWGARARSCLPPARESNVWPKRALRASHELATDVAEPLSSRATRDHRVVVLPASSALPGLDSDRLGLYYWLVLTLPHTTRHAASVSTPAQYTWKTPPERIRHSCFSFESRFWSSSNFFQ